MFVDDPPADCDAVLLSNILHDWDVPECKKIIDNLATSLPVGGRLMIHDALLNDAMDGPRGTAMYSANLFCLTEGRCYSGADIALAQRLGPARRDCRRSRRWPRARW